MWVAKYLDDDYIIQLTAVFWYENNNKIYILYLYKS